MAKSFGKPGLQPDAHGDHQGPRGPPSKTVIRASGSEVQILSPPLFVAESRMVMRDSARSVAPATLRLTPLETDPGRCVRTGRHAAPRDEDGRAGVVRGPRPTLRGRRDIHR